MTEARKDLAKALGVSAATISRDAAAGMPTDSPEAARQWREMHRRPRTVPPPRAGQGKQAGPSGVDGVPSAGYADWRCRREAAEAQAAELRLAETRGDLVRVADLRLALAKHLGAARDVALNVGSRLAPQLLHQSDQGHVQNLIDAEMRHFLTVLSGCDGVANAPAPAP